MALLPIPDDVIETKYYLIGFPFYLSGSFSLDIPPDHSIQDDDPLLAVESRSEPKMADPQKQTFLSSRISLGKMRNEKYSVMKTGLENALLNAHWIDLLSCSSGKIDDISLCVIRNLASRVSLLILRRRIIHLKERVSDFDAISLCSAAGSPPARSSRTAALAAPSSGRRSRSSTT